MNSYLVLMRGINVGGKNKVPMAKLKTMLEELGFENVVTYIQSGNVILQSKLAAKAIAAKIEEALVAAFRLDDPTIKVLVLTRAEFRAVLDERPKGFGDEPDKYHSDAIFMMGLDVDEALTAFSPLDGVDTLWPGKRVIYHQRLSARRAKTRLNRMMASPLYKSMTIRSWGTTEKLLEMLAR